MSQAVAQQRLTALEHLHELWLRLVASVLVVCVGGSIAYFFRLTIIRFLQRPLHERLYYTSPTGSFQFVMQVCLLTGFILALPLFIYNTLRFIEPAFGRLFSRRLLLTVLCFSLLLASIGIAFGYYLTLPFALAFFNSVGTGMVHPLISVNEYLSFIVGYLATFALVFQLPLLLLFINRITPFKPGSLTRWRRHVYVAAFAISLIMPSSPDPLSQVSLAIPIIVLYELSIIAIWRVNRRHVRQMVRNTADEVLPNAEWTTSPQPDSPPRMTRGQNIDGFFRRQLPTVMARGEQTILDRRNPRQSTSHLPPPTSESTPTMQTRPMSNGPVACDEAV